MGSGWIGLGVRVAALSGLLAGSAMGALPAAPASAAVRSGGPAAATAVEAAPHVPVGDRRGAPG
jgi:hypothetical protein